MKKITSARAWLILASLCLIPSLSLAQPAVRAQGRADRIPGQYIVVLKAGVRVGDVTTRHGLAPEHVYSNALNGFAGAFNSRQLFALLADPSVDWMEEDQVVTTGQSNQTLPTGVDRIDAEANTSAGGPIDVDIAIIDTGIDLTHPDLNVVNNVSYVNGAKTGNDDNGHGSHCAGIAAARNNLTGVVGVAPGARLWAVKVLSRSGSGTMSAVIKGVDYVTQHANEIEVANMSLGGGNSDALNKAIAKSVSAGVVYAVAAGNSAVDASTSSPANSPDVICVSAIVDTDGQPGGAGDATSYGVDDSFASFSNFGAAVDIAAPGVNIRSTYKGGGYAIMSGTSMASPHVAGAAALYCAHHLGASPAAVKSALQLAAHGGTFTGCPAGTTDLLLYAKDL